MTDVKSPQVVLRDALAKYEIPSVLEMDFHVARVIVEVSPAVEIVFTTPHDEDGNFYGWHVVDSSTYNSYDDREVYTNVMHHSKLTHSVDHDSMLAVQALDAYLTGRTN